MGLLRAAIPAIACAIGLLYCLVRVHQTKFSPALHFDVEVVVHGPDGSVIPAVRKR